MAETSKRKKKAATPKAAEARPRKWTRFLAKPSTMLVLATLCITPVAIGLYYREVQKLGVQPERQLTPEKVIVLDRPDWVPAGIAEDVFKLAELEPETSVFSSGLAEKLATAFAKHPWIASVERVELRGPAEAIVTANFRKPVAMVRTERGAYPIDRDGVLLPPKDFTAIDVHRFPVIVNPPILPQGPAGTFWGDISIAGAARLAEVLVPDGDKQPYWDKYDLASISLPEKTTGKWSIENIEYRLRTTGGSEVVWGLAPGLDSPREPSTEIKLKRMQKHYVDFGGFDGQQGPYEVDIRKWKEIVRRPIPRISHLP